MSHSLFDLSNRVALVTGGSKGLGKAMALGFAGAGASVIISSRNCEELAGAADEIRNVTGVRVESIPADMTAREDVDRLAAVSMERFGRVDILVNNAGSNAPQPIDAIRDEDWDRILELNLSSCMRLTRLLTPQMKTRGWGRILFISSVLGLGGKESRSAYCSTKSALLGLTRAVALDLGPFGITANCIAPGPFVTELTGRILSDEQKQVFAETTALGRFGTPNELIGPALLLASDAGSYITGTTLVVDGGALSRVF